ncbi:ABC transporter permease [Caproiciproducens sp. NJN-50]|uniref:ABC transporter permease n=1 Tax=Acutalibacteraceae TaxID=3082771 RepID=UPI000FFE1B04|nr:MULTISPECIES: ABC transporter permease [Acutalibacteraceae]QAT50067.1 ABC transporter permease [Caproiciproducens sp. NJN-50]
MKKFFSFFSKQKKFEEDVLSGKMEYSSYYKDSLRRFRKNKAAMLCLAVIFLLILVAIFARVVAPFDPDYQDYASVLARPSSKHLLGADEYGRDILSRIIYGTRVSLSIGIFAQLLASVVGVTLGAIAGYFGGVVDSIISRVMEIFSAFPDLIFAMAIMTFMGKSILNLYIALGLLTWVRTARMIRGSVIQLKEKEYVEASRASGGTSFRIIVKHLIPNCLSTIIVLVTLGIPNAIMYEASLSFLGLGIQPPTPSWGNMISAAQAVIGFLPIYSIMPGVAIMITVIAFNIFGDGLRDALDPKLRT